MLGTGNDDEPITMEWLSSIGGKINNAPAGNWFADFLYDTITEYEPHEWPPRETGENHTYLRVHSPSEMTGECMVDLFNDSDKTAGIGLTRRWPKTKGEIRRLFDGLRMNEPPAE
jgi:hypothetical protein